VREYEINLSDVRDCATKRVGSIQVEAIMLTRFVVRKNGKRVDENSHEQLDKAVLQWNAYPGSEVLIVESGGKIVGEISSTDCGRRFRALKRLGLDLSKSS
jgi:hypothetical protein